MYIVNYVTEHDWHAVVESLQYWNWTDSMYVLLGAFFHKLVPYFCVAAAKNWNSLPPEVLSSATLSTFRHKLKTYLLNLPFLTIISRHAISLHSPPPILLYSDCNAFAFVCLNFWCWCCCILCCSCVTVKLVRPWTVSWNSEFVP